MHHIKSITKKINTIRNGGVDNLKAIAEGLKNYNNYNELIEQLAEERALICAKCVYLTEEPNDILKVTDNHIYQIDEMMCNDCGCALPYKTRQSIIKCDKWIR